MAKSKQTKPTVAKRGRPPEEVPKDKADEIVEWLSSGKFLTDYCRIEGNPSRTAIYYWMEKDKEFSERVAYARARGEEVLFEENMAIVDTAPPSDMNGRTDSGYVAWQKNRVWARLEMLKRMNPKKYGDKVDVTSKGEQVGLAINIDLGEK